ncbi:hypothetical protein NOCA1130066 [metagenome]|uniref:Uncharacterized protein n=1 Tax=metagenome TaxID=256318 RepID=A0A2P2C669_9ZZZZ
MSAVEVRRTLGAHGKEVIRRMSSFRMSEVAAR